MPQGITVTVDDGFATLDVVDPSLRGQALATLLKIGGPDSVETLTRRGPRRLYRVPEGNAREAGLMDKRKAHPSAPAGAGLDTGAAEATAAAWAEAKP
ncbi:hypothetical protein [Mycobacterium paragordonae]|uniref:hypothetical protein n=1 Tax=Mycobacterium paragordonae TaxID=1389713 RepID=UPI0012E201BD|nr:hypothetical protein [Mycobacterium paragordonae]